MLNKSEVKDQEQWDKSVEKEHVDQKVKLIKELDLRSKSINWKLHKDLEF